MKFATIFLKRKCFYLVESRPVLTNGNLGVGKRPARMTYKFWREVKPVVYRMRRMRNKHQDTASYDLTKKA